MRKKIVAGNWKMNTSLADGVKLAADVNYFVAGFQNKDIGVAIAPPFTHLAEISKVIDNDRICLTAQNCSSEPSGAFTGEVSASMLAGIGVKAVIIGHSERREYFRESGELLAKKVGQVLNEGMKPIFCIGETLDQRESGKQEEVVSSQLEEGLFHLTEEEFRNIIIAYEPVWAIGTGKTASPEQAQDMHNFIRKTVKNKYGTELAENLTILYGGSCKPSNAKEIFSQPDVDGGLIGGASLKSDDFGAIIGSF